MKIRGPGPDGLEISLYYNFYDHNGKPKRNPPASTAYVKNAKKERIRSRISLPLLMLLLSCGSARAVAAEAAGRELEAGAPPLAADSLAAASDSLALQPAAPDASGGSVVTFAARDSVVYQLDAKSVELWGKARATHEGATIKAPRIVIDRSTSKLNAYANVDTAGTIVEPAVFADSKGGFDAEGIVYDFDTRKGESFNTASVADEIIFDGERVERRPNADLIIRDGTFTTCDEEEPHYWFSSSYMHVIPDSRIIARPLVMYVRPEIFSWRLPALPLLPLPYMVFPISTGRKSGLLIPRPGGDSSGFMVSNLGYFWAINDYTDLRLEGDLAANGDWRVAERFRYVNRNDYSGTITGQYREEEDGNSWYASIVHSQVLDPVTSLNANFRFIGGERERDLNTIESETVITEEAHGSASVARSFNDRNSIAAASYSRSEYLENDNSYQSVVVAFYQNRMYPWLGAGADDWRSGFSYSTNASFEGDYTSVGDTGTSGHTANAGIDFGLYRNFSDDFQALFTQGISLQSMEPDPRIYDYGYTGSRLVMPLRMQSTIGRHFHLNPSVTFTHYQPDTAVAGEGDFSTVVAGVDASTRLYGTLDTGFMEGLTGMTALRHTFAPTLSYVWNPAFEGLRFDDAGPYLWNDPFDAGRFEGERYVGMPEGQRTLGMTLRNLFHGKFRGGEYAAGAGSEGERTLQLLSLEASTGYDFAADSFGMRPLQLLASSNALSENLLLSAGGMYDFYGYDPESGERIDRWSNDDGQGLLRFVKGYVNASLSFEGERQAAGPTVSGVPAVINANQALFLERFNMGDFLNVDYGLPWQFRLSLYLAKDNVNQDGVVLDDPVTTTLANAMMRVGLSRNWQLGVNTGYDFRNRRVVFPMIQLFRDLHCWQFAFQWVPQGEFKSYSIQIGLKAARLSDIRFGKTGESFLGSSDDAE